MLKSARKNNKEYKLSLIDNNDNLVRDNPPLLDKHVVNNLYRVDNKIYNNLVIDNQMALFKCADNVFKGNYIFAYNYEHPAFKYTQCHLLMWFCSNKPLYLFRLNPFQFPYYVKMMSNLQLTDKIV